MIELWICLAIMLAIALSFICYPLLKTTTQAEQQQVLGNERLYREQLEQLKQEYAQGELSEEIYAQSLHELTTAFALEPETEIFQHKQKRKYVLALVLVLALPIFCLWWYAKLGDANGLRESLQLQSAATHLHKNAQAFHSPEAVIATMVKEVNAHPERLRGWMLLGRLYMSMREFSLAAPAYAKAYALRPEDLAVLEQYVEALYFANDQMLDPKAKQIVAKILTKKPNDLKIINLVALDAYVRGDYEKAITTWREILAKLPKNSPQLTFVEGAIHTAQNREAFSKQKPTLTITAKVSLSAKLKAAIPKGAYLLVFAKAVNGPPMPLAVFKQKLSKADFPEQVSITDKMAMIPAQSIKDYHQVRLYARISTSGGAMPEKGDLQGMSMVLDPSTQKALVSIEIDKQL